MDPMTMMAFLGPLFGAGGISGLLGGGAAPSAAPAPAPTPQAGPPIKASPMGPPPASIMGSASQVGPPAALAGQQGLLGKAGEFGKGFLDSLDSQLGTPATLLRTGLLNSIKPGLGNASLGLMGLLGAFGR